MHKLTVVSIITLLALSSVSMAQSRKPVQKPRHAAASSATQNLAPEAAALRDAQKFWPNVPLCDDGGYRIRPCGGRGEARIDLQWLVARKGQMQAGVRTELLTTPHVMAIPHGPWSILAVVVTKHFLADSIRAEQRPT